MNKIYTEKEVNRREVFLFLMGIIIGMSVAIIMDLTTAKAEIYSRNDDFYLNISKEVAQNHNWTYPNYVCRDFAHDLMVKLNLNGYLSSTRTGKYYPCLYSNWQRFRCRHTWVEVWVGKDKKRIEATTGQVISDLNYKTYYIG